MKSYRSILFFCAIVASLNTSAQCRIFVKNHCAEAMQGYIMSENFNGAKMMPGDEAEMKMAFYGGEEYRMMVCHHPMLEGVSFKVMDSNKNILFDNSGQDIDHFDFRMESTEELTMEMKILGDGSLGITPMGCVAILVGKKLKDTNAVNP